MTVCIWALSDWWQWAVLIADRMVTFTTGWLQYQSDHERHKKTYCISNTAEILVAWDTILWDTICKMSQRVVAEYFSKPENSWANITIEDIIDVVKNQYQLLRLQLLEDHLLNSRWITLQQYQTWQCVLPANTINNIEQVISTHNIQVELIVAWLNREDKYSIYTILNPWIISCHDVIWFISTGSWWPHATYKILQSEYNANLTNEEVKAIIIDAKRASEFAPWVWKTEDLILLPKKDVESNN